MKKQGNPRRLKLRRPYLTYFYAMTVGTDPCVCPVTNDEKAFFRRL